MIPNLFNLKPWLLRAGSIWFDLTVAAGSFLAAYAIAVGIRETMVVPGIWEKLLAFSAISALCFVLFSVTRGSWRYVSIPEFLALVKASVLAVGIYTVGAFLVSRGDNVPRSVPILTAFFMIAAMAGARLSYRLLMEGRFVPPQRGARPAIDTKNVLVCGLTYEAESFIRTTRRLPGSPVTVVGIIDDTRMNHARSVQGVRVLGGLSDLDSLVAKLARKNIHVRELVVAETQPGRHRLSKILEIATAAGLKLTRIPGATETSYITTSALLEPKPIEIGDLLGRPEVKSDVESMARLISGRVVLATGAGGSIGSELCRQIAMFEPRCLIVADNSEFALYLLDKELRERHPNLDIVTRIVDVRNNARISRLFEQHRPAVVFHAAALKHVPLVEENPLEAIKTNVLGTRNIANAAMKYEASTFIMISTDKAVNPTNVMGATKRAAEAYCQALDVISEKTRYKTVRFGNVLGSNGSVVPRFQEQIAAGGPVTVTHPHIVRYFMTIPEAVRLVLHASAHALRRQSERGKIMVLDMGMPVRIVDLAERMIQLAGFKPHVDIDIVFSGLRPGEKLFEELFDPSEVRDGRTEEGYVIASPRLLDKMQLHATLDSIQKSVDSEDAERSLQLLREIVPEYQAAPLQAADLDAEEAPPVEPNHAVSREI